MVSEWADTRPNSLTNQHVLPAFGSGAAVSGISAAARGSFTMAANAPDTGPSSRRMGTLSSTGKCWAIVQHWHMRHHYGLPSEIVRRNPSTPVESISVTAPTDHGGVSPPAGSATWETVKIRSMELVLLHQGIQHCGLVQQAGAHALCNCGEQLLARFHARSEHARPQVGVLGLVRCQALLRAGIQHPHQAQAHSSMAASTSTTCAARVMRKPLQRDAGAIGNDGGVLGMWFTPHYRRTVGT